MIQQLALNGTTIGAQHGAYLELIPQLAPYMGPI